MLVKSRDFSDEELSHFKLLQKEVYGVLVDVSEKIDVGMTELDTASMIREAFRKFDVRSWFHVPVALFGDRTAYPGEFGQLEARPTLRKLKPGDAIILDAAPIIDGYLVDCSYGVPREDADSETFAACDSLLSRLRNVILDGAQARGNMRDIARQVDKIITDEGFENCHKKHIGLVLAHRAAITTNKFMSRRRIWGLSPLPVGWFFYKSFQSRNDKASETPNWNHTRQSNTTIQDGLWCVEPHVARNGIGLKFEEMLLVDGDGARYLDDDLPHVNRWRERGLSQSS